MIHADSLGEIVDRYDAFLIDQFGVLLDGAGAYSYAPAALDRLFTLGKKSLLISNSGKRSASNVARLSRLGFTRATFLDVLSSGEVAHLEVARRLGGDIPAGAAIWAETSDDVEPPLAGLDIRWVERPEQADLLWIGGARPAARSLAEYEELLSPAASRGVPMICANPDTTALTPAGRAFAAGAVAKTYERLGGAVEWIGKPYPAIYAEAMRRLGRVNLARVLAIGDSPAHDILGGARAGTATALVRTGVHEGDSDAELAARCEAIGVVPDVVLSRFAF